jgi:hypothetical protein
MGATALLSVLLASAAPAAAPPTTPQHHERKPDERFRLQPLTGGVHALYGRGGNVGFLVGPDDLDGLRALRRYVTDVIEAAKKARAAGRTREQYLAEVDLPAYREYQGYPDRFKANAAAAWDELGS